MKTPNQPESTLHAVEKPVYGYLFWIFIINILFFAFLEIRHPFFFLNDDNRTMFLPNYIHNFRSICHGEFPFFNFSQYLGIPHFSTPMAAVFYPIIYVAAGISKFGLGHYFATIDILVIMHLIAGALGFFYLLKKMSIPAPVALWGALVWEFNGFSIFVSDSWWVISCAGAFLPWLIYYGLTFFSHPRKKHLIGLSILRAVYFYSGYPQYFVYSSIFEISTLLVLTWSKQDRRDFSRKWAGYLFGFGITLALILPLMLPIRYHTQMSAKTGALQYNVFNATSYKVKPMVQGFVNPFRMKIKHVDQEWEKKYQLSFFGYLAQILAVIGLFYIFLDRKREYGYLYWTALINGLLAFLLTSGYINRVVYLLPVLNRFTAPFKYMLYLQFFMSMFAVLGFYVIFTAIVANNGFRRFVKPVLTGVVILCQVVNMLLLFSLLPVRSFNFRPHKDHLPLTEPFARQLSGARLVTLGANIDNPYTIKSLGFNYATIWGLYQMSGFDPLVPVQNVSHAIAPDIPLRDKFGKYRSFIQFASFNNDTIPFFDFRMWGVTWYVIPKNKSNIRIDPEYAGLLAGRNLVAKDTPDTYAYLEANGLSLAYEDEFRKIYKDPLARPLVYWLDKPEQPGIEYRIETDAIEIKTNCPNQRTLIVNFMHHPFFKARIDSNRNVKVLSLSPYNQMALNVPAGNHVIRLYYSDPNLKMGLLSGVLLMALYLLIFKFFQIRQQNKHKKSKKG